MNVANLQIEGLLMAIAALNRLLVSKHLVTEAEITSALESAESSIRDGERFADGIPPANRDAMCFPIRLLQLANHAQANGGTPDFSELARTVGQTKSR